MQDKPWRKSGGLLMVSTQAEPGNQRLIIIYSFNFY